MAKADDLFGADGTIRKRLLDSAQTPEAQAQTVETCEDVGMALKLWDGVFSGIHKIDPTEVDCEIT